MQHLIAQIDVEARDSILQRAMRKFRPYRRRRSLETFPTSLLDAAQKKEKRARPKPFSAHLPRGF